jgi:Ca2+-transporting ATPase
MELIIDPTCSVVFEEEGEEEDIMRQKPRSPKEPLIDKTTIISSILEGIVIFLFVMFGFMIFEKAGFTETKSRAFAFSILVFAYISLVLAKRSFTKTIFESFKQKNNKLWIVILAIGILLLSALYAPFLQRVFGFSSLSFRELLIAGALGLLSVLGLELFKLFGRKKVKEITK